MGKSNKFSLTTKSHSSTRVNPYDKITLSALNISCPDKQVILPKLESNGLNQVCIELYSFMIFIIALGTQYLNLYRSVWWITSKSVTGPAAAGPRGAASVVGQPIHYHLIDLDVSQFSLIFIGQSSLISILHALLQNATMPSSLKQLLAQSSLTSSSPTTTATTTTTSSSSSSATTAGTTTQTTSNGNSNNNNTSSSTISNSIAASISSSSSSSSSSSTSSASSTPSTATTTATDVHNNNNNTSTNSHNSSTSSSNGSSNINNTTTSTITNSNNKQHQTSSLQQQQQQQQHATQQADNAILTTIVTATASWICNYYLLKSAFRIWSNFGLNGISCISYPIVVSIFMNSTHIIQIVEDCRKTGKLNLSFLTLSMTLFSCHFKFDDDKLCHNCSNQPDEIRDEVERFRTIFNERLKFVLFKSILLAYYSSFVPICFAQSFHYYDHTWATQHVALTWFSSLIMLISSSYTPHFYDVLHRSAFHFGKWQKLEARNTLVPCINWSENVIYPQGVVVKHYRDYFRSESVSNCAQPGVSSHLCYYIVFSNPKIGYAAALALLGLLLTCQMYLLLVSTEWYKLIAMTNLMFINIHSIFRLVKSLVVITKIYKEKH